MSKLLLLHGAIGSSRQLEPLAEKLKDEFDIYLFNFSGHGGKPVPEEPFSIEMFSGDVINFIKKSRLEGINVFGYSMGGYVALYIAAHFPETINKIFTTATKFNWNEESSVKEAALLNSDKINEKVPAFAEILKDLHSPEDWKMVLKKTAEMMKELGKNNELSDGDLSEINNEVLLSVLAVSGNIQSKHIIIPILIFPILLF